MIIECYFFVEEKIDKGEIKVEFCPSTNMSADVITKPLQESIFRICLITIY